MPTSTELREQRANIWSQMQEVMSTAQAAGRDLTAEEAQKYDRAEIDFDKLEAEIERQERHEARAAKMGAVDRTGVIPPQHGDDVTDEAGAEYARVFDRFLRDGAFELTAEDRQILQAGFVQDKDIRNAAGVGTGSAGGYAVPPQFRDIFIETMKWYGPMLEEAETIFTNTGANLPWPTNDDTGNVGALLAENTQVSEQDVTLGQASLDAYMYTSKLVRVSYQLLQDRPDFDTWLARRSASASAASSTSTSPPAPAPRSLTASSPAQRRVSPAPAPSRPRGASATTT
jgi:HK97 family phage major capsid protein